jgi:hypothetical protein
MAVLFNVIGGMMGGAAAWCVAHRGGPGGVERVKKVGGTYFFGVLFFFWGGRDWIVFVWVLIPSGLNVTAGGKDVFVVNVFL